MVFYSLLFGIGVGLAYTAPIVAGELWITAPSPLPPPLRHTARPP